MRASSKRVSRLQARRTADSGERVARCLFCKLISFLILQYVRAQPLQKHSKRRVVSCLWPATLGTAPPLPPDPPPKHFSGVWSVSKVSARRKHRRKPWRSRTHSFDFRTIASASTPSGHNHQWRLGEVFSILTLLSTVVISSCGGKSANRLDSVLRAPQSISLVRAEPGAHPSSPVPASPS